MDSFGYCNFIYIKSMDAQMLQGSVITITENIEKKKTRKKYKIPQELKLAKNLEKNKTNTRIDSRKNVYLCRMQLWR